MVQIRPNVPPIVKQIALSNKGGVGADPTVNNASKDHSNTAIKPMAVAIILFIQPKFSSWSLMSANFGQCFHCGATLLVNMRDIEPRKEDDGFDGAFLSP